MKEKGFTLVELLVVILILGVLIALAVPNFVLLGERARISTVKANMRLVQLALEGFALDHEGFYPPAGGEAGADNPGPPLTIFLSWYFPGGDPYAEEGEGRKGQPPVNPYTGLVYNSDEGIDVDLLYGEGYTTTDEPGVVANPDPEFGEECVYDDEPVAPNEVPGTICVATHSDEVTGKTLEYGIVGWGRRADVPIVERVIVNGEERLQYFVLHN